jgi:hypothetical protein
VSEPIAVVDAQLIEAWICPVGQAGFEQSVTGMLRLNRGIVGNGSYGDAAHPGQVGPNHVPPGGSGVYAKVGKRVGVTSRKQALTVPHQRGAS